MAPLDAADRFGRLLELYDLADAFCRNERLLTLARTAEQVEFQSWLFGEFVRQANGDDPKPWSDEPRGDAVPRSAVAQLVEPVVVDPEVMGDLVHHGDPHLAHQLVTVGAHLQQRAAGRS